MTSLRMTINQDDRRIAAFAALAILIHVLEAAFPSPLPGVKPGLANLVTLVVFLLYGFRAAVWVSMLRVMAGSLVAGTFLSPTFVLSLGGGLAVLGLLGLLSVTPRHLGLGPHGIAVLSALAHTGTQFLLAYWLIIPHVGLLALLPVLMSFALLFGFISGSISLRVYQRLKPI